MANVKAKPASSTPVFRAKPRAAGKPFWRNVDRRGPDECWPWLGYADPKRGPSTMLDGRSLPAGRVAYERTRGPVPDGAMVVRTCADRMCVNPRHRKVTADPAERAPKTPRPIVDRIMDLVRKTPTCWVWQGATWHDGRPSIRPEGKGSNVSPARAMFEHHHGKLQPGAQVWRTCKNKLCVRPEHLALLVLS